MYYRFETSMMRVGLIVDSIAEVMSIDDEDVAPPRMKEQVSIISIFGGSEKQRTPSCCCQIVKCYWMDIKNKISVKQHKGEGIL